MTDILSSGAHATVNDRSRALQRIVGARVATLQHGLLRGDMAATASMAALRRAIGAEAGSVPEVWELTIAGLGEIDRPGTSTEPTRAERACSLALSLYAINQRSKSVPMHVSPPSAKDLEAMSADEQNKTRNAYRDRAGLGRAAAKLRRFSGFNEEAVIRRFTALGTAIDFAELSYHLRGMVTQFNGESIGLDYGLLAHDLYRFQYPIMADSVRLQWGRDFHSFIKNTENTDVKNTENTDTSTDDSAAGAAKAGI